MAGAPKRYPDEIISNWGQLLDGIVFPPTEFYTSIQARVAAREIPKINVSDIKFRQGKGFSGSRVYLRVNYEDLVFDICAAPFGKEAMFVSWWLGRFDKIGCLGTILRMIPVVGDIIKLKNSTTYYTADVAGAFQGAIKAAVMDALDEIMQSKGVPLLKGDDRKPVMKDFFAR